jgi:hypothetical protein
MKLEGFRPNVAVRGLLPEGRRYFGVVSLDPTRVGRDADVAVRREIAGDLPSATDQVVRTVTKNSRTLKFDTHGFERE